MFHLTSKRKKCVLNAYEKKKISATFEFICQGEKEKMIYRITEKSVDLLLFLINEIYATKKKAPLRRKFELIIQIA